MESGGWKGYYAWLELGEGCFMKIRDPSNSFSVIHFAEVSLCGGQVA